MQNMSSCENGVSEWNPRHVRGTEELLDPMASPGLDNRFAPVESLSGIDQYLHISGNADSAYSSFSGGSNLPEYPVPLCYSEHDNSLPLEQLTYVDTGYVRGIYNPCAIREELRQTYENKGARKSAHYNLEITGPSRQHGSIPTPGVLHRSPSPLGNFPPSLLCPPAHVDCYEAKTSVDPTPGICFDCSIPADWCIQEPSKVLLAGTARNSYNDDWLSSCEDETRVTEKDAGCFAKLPTVKESNSSVFITPSAVSQEKWMPDSSQSILQAQSAIRPYKIPETMNSDSAPLLQTSHNAVNDTQKNKQCFHACSVHKPPTAEGGLPSTVAVSSQPEGQLHQALQLLRIHDCSELEPDTDISTTPLKYLDRSLPGTCGLGVRSSYEEKKDFICSGEENSRGIWQPLLKQQTTMPKPHSCGLDFAETPHAIIYEPTKTVSYFGHDTEDTISQPFSGFREPEENDRYSRPELLVNPRLEETLKTVGFSKQPFSKKAENQSQEESASQKINRKTTPLLYYLSGGKNPNVMSHKAPNAREPEASSVKSSRHCPGSAGPGERLGDSRRQVGKTACTEEGLIRESCASSSLDEKFKDDYREKLKVAQSKVLRETSFKRKDLQMSLPIRLKPKPSSRPSIQHLRSLSLSSTNEEPKSIPSLEPLGRLRMEEEPQRLPAVRIGGRRRATTEQKTISYSEPEKLNQLEDQRDQNGPWEKRNARSRSDEISEQGTRVLRAKAPESRERTLTKAELKQIQHKALLEYMERKTGQWPPSTNNNIVQQQQQQQQQQLPLQGRTANPKRLSEDGSSSPCPSGKLQSMCRIPEPPSFPAALTSTDGRDSTSVSAKGHLPSICSATSKGHGEPRSTPSPVQDFSTPTSCLVVSAEDHGRYLIHPNSLSEVILEADQRDASVAAKQSTYRAGRSRKSVEEPGSSETTRWPSLSQSTDHLLPLKAGHVFLRAETGQGSQGANHQPLQDQRESTLRHLPRPSPAEDATDLALEEAHGGKRNKDTLPSTSGSPSLNVPGRRFLRSSVQGDSHDPSPVFSLSEMEEDVFKDSSDNVSDMDSDLPHFPRQNVSLTVVRETPGCASAASILQIYMKGKQIKEEPSTSFTVAGKDESNLGDSKEDENSAGNPPCPESACEHLAFCLPKKSKEDSQLEKEMSEKSPESSVSHGQHLEGHYRTPHSEGETCPCTAPLDSQGCENTGWPLSNSKALQNDWDCKVPGKAGDSSVAQSKSLEHQVCDDPAVEIIAKDKPLVDVLTPHPMRRTTLELMEDLFPVNFSTPGRSSRWKWGMQPAHGTDQRGSGHASDLSHRANSYLGQGAEDGIFDIHQKLRENSESLDDPKNITSPKRELISSIQLELRNLWEERELIQSEAKEQAEHGKALESMVQGLCKPNEYERYMMFIGDLEKVVSLLLCLSSRLARVQNAMEKIDDHTDAEEKQSLKERHRLLSRQREDAKDLKENLDRRERVVSGILSKYMTESQLQEYRHFVQEKTSLLIEQKDLDEQIKFLEEQLERLQASIVP
ncbi:hypothetical protein JRQ81_002674 [Phrynocephalus forsythii]|uniref:Protein Shroom1 n=1 Tax=Phrynocephalus forsythii TaxID=171643 RepID=A0A9Q0XLN5_9SAUR|nr:hypothetical protein JRQ81_002674 [Phrynocephalus forsythii]